MASVSANPARVRPDASALVVFKGPASTAISWVLTGSGALSDADVMTDAQGRASATYTPGTVGDVVTITVTYGA